MGIQINLPGNPLMRGLEAAGQGQQAAEEAAFVEQSRELALEAAAEEIRVMQTNIQKGQQEMALKAELAETQRKWQEALKNGAAPSTPVWSAFDGGIEGVEFPTAPPPDDPRWLLWHMGNEADKRRLERGWAQEMQPAWLEGQLAAIQTEGTRYIATLGAQGGDVKALEAEVQRAYDEVKLGSMTPSQGVAHILKEFTEESKAWIEQEGHIKFFEDLRTAAAEGLSQKKQDKIMVAYEESGFREAHNKLRIEQIGLGEWNDERDREIEIYKNIIEQLEGRLSEQQGGGAETVNRWNDEMVAKSREEVDAMTPGHPRFGEPPPAKPTNGKAPKKGKAKVESLDDGVKWSLAQSLKRAKNEIQARGGTDDEIDAAFMDIFESNGLEYSEDAVKALAATPTPEVKPDTRDSWHSLYFPGG